MIEKNKEIKKTAIVQQCSTCRYGSFSDAQGVKVPNGSAYCVYWNGLKGATGVCALWGR